MTIPQTSSVIELAAGVPFPRHFSAAAYVPASTERVFARLDDQTKLGEHMESSSAMMGGGKMAFEFDAGRGMAVGSHIRMGGSAFGIRLFVDEMVTERAPPRRKVWRTVGRQRILIIDSYEMGFAVDPEGAGSRLRVWIDYAPAKGFFGRLLTMLFGGLYARWCVRTMVKDAVRFFSP